MKKCTSKTIYYLGKRPNYYYTEEFVLGSYRNGKYFIKMVALMLGICALGFCFYIFTFPHGDFSLTSFFVFLAFCVLASGIIVLFSLNSVKFTDSALFYRRWFFSKDWQEIRYELIDDCVFSRGVWKHNRKYLHGRGIFLINKREIYSAFTLNSKLMWELSERLDKSKLFVVDDKKRKTISKYYEVDYFGLTQKQQMILLKNYSCIEYPSKENAKKKLKRG